MDGLNARAFSDLQYASMRDLAFDTYCMQHVAKYCVSAKSYAAHLSRLCCGVEYDRSPAVYGALQKWLNGKTAVVKPEVLPFLGTLTIVDVVAAQDADEPRARILAWAEDVWDAYASQQALARDWVKAALKSQGLVLEPKHNKP
jgi:hypothetical protein